MNTPNFKSSYDMVNAPLTNIANQKALEYFVSLQGNRNESNLFQSSAIWDHRARLWKKKQDFGMSNDVRIHHFVQELEQKGLLKSDYHIIDIGCGPGKFAAAFAQKVKHVTGIDISNQMIEQGNLHLKQREIKNVLLKTCDFTTLDINSEFYGKRFDLVFSSMTPAIYDLKTLLKAMSMSRHWCCNITHINGTNILHSKIMSEVFHRPLEQKWSGKCFYSFFNTLFLLGYYPETSFFHRKDEHIIHPDESYAELIMEYLLKDEENTSINKRKILLWLKKNADKNGELLETSQTCYGTIIWDVNIRDTRTEFTL